MAISNEVELLKNIFTEVDVSKTRIFISNQCRKAQASLLDKLKNKIKQEKEILNFITDGNTKIEVEIKLAEQELNNLIIACKTIKCGNIEIRKELLLKLEEDLEFSKRIESGEKKYEELWLTSKRRFENNPLVQQCLEGKKKIQLIESKINNLRNKCVGLSDEIKMKKRAAQDLTQEHVIDLANFLVNDRPKLIKMIQGRINEIQVLTREVDSVELRPVMNSRYSKVKIIELQENSQPEKAIREEKKFDHNENTIVMPKLQLMDVDLDVLGAKLDQIKKIELNVATTEENKIKPLGYKMDVESSSTKFNNKWESFCSQSKSYSHRKLIHILGDITLEKNQTLNIISKVDTNKLQNVSVIGSQQTGEELLKICPLSEEKVSQPSNKIDGNMDNCEERSVQSPTQILDRKKKKVSFDLLMENAPSEIIETENSLTVVSNVTSEGGKNNETLNSHDVSLDNDEGSDQINDKLKAHKLCSFPEFVYAKHFMSNKIIEDKVITSKFFDAKNTQVSDPSVISSPAMGEQDTKIQENNSTIPPTEDMYKNKTFDQSSSKMTQNVQKTKFPISGLLFEHGSQAIPDSLNISLNATGFDGDNSYPQCLDSSVLLSPKADELMDATNNNITVMPQEVPSFMSGGRKTGSSFFERLSNDAKPNTNTTNTEGNFNFNFSGEEKKNRGGFFNMFF